MKTTFWTAIIVLIVGLWDMQFAIRRWPKKNQDKKSGTQGHVVFLILGIIFVITGIVLFFVK